MFFTLFCTHLLDEEDGTDDLHGLKRYAFVAGRPHSHTHTDAQTHAQGGGSGARALVLREAQMLCLAAQAPAQRARGRRPLRARLNLRVFVSVGGGNTVCCLSSDNAERPVPSCPWRVIFLVLTFLFGVRPWGHQIQATVLQRSLPGAERLCTRPARAQRHCPLRRHCAPSRGAGRGLLAAAFLQKRFSSTLGMTGSPWGRLGLSSRP